MSRDAVSRPLMDYPQFQRVHEVLHKLWSAAKDAPGYDKRAWIALEHRIIELVHATRRGDLP